MPRGSAARRATPLEETPPKPRPFLKWVGGKGQLIEQFQPLLPRPEWYRRYFEPFIGSAALFFHLLPGDASLSDVNAEIIHCYRAVRAHPGKVIAELGKHRYDEESYYRVRNQDPRELAPAAAAARTIYLNKTGFNGLYRVNRAGTFNVPMGRYTNPGFNSPALFANLLACAEALQTARVARGDFEKTLARAGKNDFAYLDPPYVPVSPTADFTSYARGGFDWSEQERLARVCRALWKRGTFVMLSNSDTPEVHELYTGFRVTTVKASRSINSRVTKRGKVSEVVVRNYDEKGLLG